jgi:hypothetical protein
MAGERMHPDGWTEISAVCTDPAWRGHGFGTRLIRAVGAGIRERGEVPFLHAIAVNPALRLYAEIGFAHRKDTRFGAARVPGRATALSVTAGLWRGAVDVGVNAHVVQRARHDRHRRRGRAAAIAEVMEIRPLPGREPADDQPGGEQQRSEMHVDLPLLARYAGQQFDRRKEA